MAGVRLETAAREWIRLYPVTFRELGITERFHKYQMVNLRVFRSGSDSRPESFKPNLDSVELGEVIGTDGGTWRRRWEYLGDLPGATSTCELIDRQSRGADAPSLGLIKPVEVLDLEIESNDGFTADQRALAELAAAGDLFSEGRAVLEPAPYRLKYRYRCSEDACRSHSQTLIDWEAGQAARNWLANGYAADQLPGLLRHKFLDEVCAPTRDTYFYVGNQHQHRGSFLVLGLFWPPAGSRPHPSLF
ncbi:hypothetical protein [Mycobacterium interjectum]|uniref:hypothetical protein n=1 Tax=Mycobacterium interjectum TaxID=33895 RepID=UPI0008351D57|nr:hypothetical protein [Mycobacterium interjectum]MCV7090022.1 hypothetical protein [Mycobacterium interjectum]